MSRRVVRGAIGRAVVVTAPTTAVLYLGYAAVGLPYAPFDVFDWMTRVLPGSLVRFGIDTMVSFLLLLGLNVKDTAKTAEQAMAVSGFVVTLVAVGTLFLVALSGRQSRRVVGYGGGLGLLVAVPLLAVVLPVWGTAEVSRAVGVVWLLGVFVVWGLAMGWVQLRAPVGTGPPVEGEVEAAVSPAAPSIEPAPGPGMERVSAGETAVTAAEAYTRRRFLLKVGGAAATITVGGTALGAYLRGTDGGESVATPSPVSLPTEGRTVQPVPGTRPEYTPLDEHYQIDINTTPPRIAADDWRLQVHGEVDNPLELTLQELKDRYPEVSEFVTLSCISNRIAGPLISTTLWTGVPLADVLADAGVREGAGYVRMLSEDGFHETLSLELVREVPGIMLVHSFDGQPLPQKHGYPLRIHIPNRYGMKQPKWIVELEVTKEYREGYWVERGWSEEAAVRTTSVIDAVAVDSPIERGGQTYIPVGGIAYAGTRGISAVEVQVDEGPWEPAEVREALSARTWVIWRYEWPFAEGAHSFTVRCVDGEGTPQVSEEAGTFPDGATGLHTRRQML